MSTQIEVIRGTFNKALSMLTDEQLLALVMAPYAELRESAELAAA